ncbi:hypothetical protein OE766_29700 [Pararhizobium sp. YC-54]|uniref:hypothetical protein n=1 Tax=Pararhizobium sp. YC-54 TaxID=2986920 RepID=UPI0021F79725|nr:hypothetical protein [Pararhizobium sp. YC-54]MCW0002356.1 hypothetical protein [Pararhizobium sp. YC-54]
MKFAAASRKRKLGSTKPVFLLRACAASTALEKEPAHLPLELEAATPKSAKPKNGERLGHRNPGDPIVVNPAMFQSVLDALTTALKGAGMATTRLWVTASLSVPSFRRW